MLEIEGKGFTFGAGVEDLESITGFKVWCNAGSSCDAHSPQHATTRELTPSGERFGGSLLGQVFGV